MNKSLQSRNVITDRLLRGWIRCNRKAWLDLHEDNEKKIWTAHRTLQLDHQYKSLSVLIKEKPGKGLNAFTSGANTVSGVRLKGKHPSGNYVEAHPELLQKIKGRSKWGDFAYRPVVARYGKRTNLEHLLILALNSFLLEEIQESRIETGLVVSHRSNHLETEKVVLTNRIKRKLNESLIRLKETLIKPSPIPVISDRRRCLNCSWKAFCDNEAALEGHLSEISGIGRKREGTLNNLGINKVHDLAASNPFELEHKLKKYGEMNSEFIHKAVKQANVQMNGLEERILDNESLPELNNVPGILLYDIESDPDHKHDFLHGFIHIPNTKHKGFDMAKLKYSPIFNLSRENEKACWMKISKKLYKLKDWPIIHYGETELISFKKLAKNHGVTNEDLQIISNRFIDIHKCIRSTWLLPVNSYGLKVVANWAGFKWSNKGADGAKALLWWRSWEKTKHLNTINQNYLNWILDYNKDDCLATWHLAKWLQSKDKNKTDGKIFNLVQNNHLQSEI